MNPSLSKIAGHTYSDASYGFIFLRISVGVEKHEVWDLLRAGYIGFLWSNSGVPTLKYV